MTQSFYALCHTENGTEVKRLRLNADVRNDMVTLFNQQEHKFLSGIEEEIPFGGDWKPDRNELLTVENHPDVASVIQAVSANAQSIPDIDVNNFLSENIKAILTAVDVNGSTKLLIQRFSERQILSRKFALEFDNNHFNRIQNTSFSLEESLSCIVEDGILKFKSYHNARAIFDLKNDYVCATNADIDEFFSPNLPVSIENLPEFKQATADQGTRKLIHSILNKRNLGQYTGAQIQNAANEVDLSLELDATGKVKFSLDRKETKNILHFLDDKLYEAPLSSERYITNSNKPVDS